MNNRMNRILAEVRSTLAEDDATPTTEPVTEGVNEKELGMLKYLFQAPAYHGGNWTSMDRAGQKKGEKVCLELYKKGLVDIAFRTTSKGSDIARGG